MPWLWELRFATSAHLTCLSQGAGGRCRGLPQCSNQTGRAATGKTAVATLASAVAFKGKQQCLDWGILQIGGNGDPVRRLGIFSSPFRGNLKPYACSHPWNPFQFPLAHPSSIHPPDDDSGLDGQPPAQPRSSRWSPLPCLRWCSWWWPSPSSFASTHAWRS